MTMEVEIYKSDDMIAMQRYLRQTNRQLIRAVPSRTRAEMTIMHVPAMISQEVRLPPVQRYQGRIRS